MNDGNLQPIPGAFSLGVCYYPEQWPADRWAGYARQMRELGLRYVRIAEFSWARMEPTPGEYEWGWLDDAIATLAAEGLEVILCTPTATPPAWLVQQHPEILPVDREGRVRRFGSRRHYDFSSQAWRDHAREITRRVVERYGSNPAVVGWQVDNEFGDHETGLSYSDAAREGFQRWCAERYGTLDALNEAWGTVFWSQEYSAWNQVDLPNLTVAEPNPSHVLDFRRYSSEQVVSFLREQVDSIRKGSPGRWVTHNFMRLCSEFDHYPAARLLDFASLDVYPTGAVEFTPMSEAERVRWARTGNPDTIAFNHDLYRSMSPSGAHWVMEGQVGQINWAPSNPLPARGAVDLWIAQAQAHGAGCYSVFRWRAATVAQELMHSGMLRHDETLDRGGEEVRDYEGTGTPVVPMVAPVALLHDYESLWIYDEQPHSADASYWEQVMLFYAALRSLGVGVDIRHPDEELGAYRVVVAPALQLVGADRAAHIARFADRPLVFGPRTGFRTPSGRVHEEGQPGPLRELLGVSLLNFDGLRPGMVEQAGNHRVTTWAEAYRPLAGSTVTHHYTSGPLDGEAAVVRKGSVTTIGAWSASLVREVLAGACGEAGIETVDLPAGVRVTRQAGREWWQNWNAGDERLPDGTTIGPVRTLVRNDPMESEETR